MKPWDVKGRDVTYTGRVIYGFDSAVVAGYVADFFNGVDASVEEWHRVTRCRCRYNEASVMLDVQRYQYVLSSYSTGVNVTDGIEGYVKITVDISFMDREEYAECSRGLERIVLFLRDRQRPAIPVYIPN